MGRLGLIGVMVLAGLFPAQAAATFPGEDGRIAFALDKQDALFGTDIAKIEPDGSGFQRLTDLPGYASNPAWSPDGTRLAFTLVDQSRTFLYVMSADGSNQRAITEIRGVYGGSEASPSFSGDGERIAYSTGYAIETIRTDGSDMTPAYFSPDIVEYTRRYGLSYPVYSPDGGRITFVRDTPDLDAYGIWSVRSDGTGLRHLLARPLYLRALDYRPDGKQIVFMMSDRGPYRMRPDGTHLRKFRPFPRRFSSRPTYSPTGRAILTTRRTSDVGQTTSCSDLVSFTLDGLEERGVTSNCREHWGESASVPDWQPLPE
jgi:Tol biopolymer transport system component